MFLKDKRVLLVSAPEPTTEKVPGLLDRHPRTLPVDLRIFRLAAKRTLGLQVYKYYLLWALNDTKMTYFGLLGAPVKESSFMQLLASKAAQICTVGA